MLWAKISFQFEGIHKWNEASGEVEFLKFPHRHMFFVTIWISQEHNNRDVEYITLKRLAREQFCDVTNLGTMSCEQIAEGIIEELKKKYPNKQIRVEVLEDDEQGVLLE